MREKSHIRALRVKLKIGASVALRPLLNRRQAVQLRPGIFNMRAIWRAAMSRATRLTFVLSAITVSVIAFSGTRVFGQAAKPDKTALAPSTDEPTNSAPNPYETIKDFFKLPQGRSWGSTSAVAIDKDGKSIWATERCGVGENGQARNSCLADPTTGKMIDLPVILKFDEKGNLVKSFGSGILVFPHGIEV